MIRRAVILALCALVLVTACARSDAIESASAVAPSPSTVVSPPTSLAPALRHADGGSVTATDPFRVLILGDSVTYELAPPLVEALNGVPLVETTEVTQWGFALSGDNRLRWRDTWPGMIRNADPDLVIIQIGTWDIDVNILGAERDPNPSDADWEQSFAVVLDEAAFRLGVGGADILWLSMLPGPDPAPSEQLNDATRALASRNPMVSWLDAAAAIRTSDGVFIEVDAEGRYLRKPDGVHLCRDGAADVVELIVADIGERYGVTFGAWTEGEWRNSGRYEVDPCFDYAAAEFGLAGPTESTQG